MAKVQQPQVETILNFFKKEETGAKVEEDDEEASGAACGFIPDFQSDNKHLYAHGGISFGDFGALMIQKSLK